MTLQISPTPLHDELHIGIMSGTSMDGIDAVIASFNSDGKPSFIAHTAHEFTSELKQQLMDLQTPGMNELHREALAGNALAVAYANLVKDLLAHSGLKHQDIRAIGAHGQTIRHQPGIHDEYGYTLQTLNASLLAELTDIDVIADFRSRDIAAKGQGAPLVPAFHAAQFGSHSSHRAILNIGGIANLTLLPKTSQEVIGFDCGPGNVLLDLWINRHLQQSFDKDGAWGRSGDLIPELLEILLDETYLSLAPPKSTGRDLFNESWLMNKLAGFENHPPQNIQTTLTHYTVRAIVLHMKTYQNHCDELFVCGGGVRNQFLMSALKELLKLELPQVTLASTDLLDIDPQTVEALAFAWLSWAFCHDICANLPAVTGALGPRLLGARYPR